MVQSPRVEVFKITAERSVSLWSVVNAKHSSEEITQMAKDKKEAVAEVGGESCEVRDVYHGDRYKQTQDQDCGI